MKHAANKCPSIAKEWRREARDYIASQATQIPGKMKASAEVGSVDSDSDSNGNIAALEQPVKKARMELQVASSSKQITPFDRMYATEGERHWYNSASQTDSEQKRLDICLSLCGILQRITPSFRRLTKMGSYRYVYTCIYGTLLGLVYIQRV
ncbi:hypothetical protein K503DRAFT_101800 [Rhizopogon vinicolor AM-OR11-026]|uniref:Uncharacterized protein n=1 Tax=Rhizopogon vinicolor AM-OR11-026 TaxID=1314800 RepID=A0A1B7MFA2_9AGAM|nr:hypothetical protein K503DRAFT_101800 [Rhizopogon vinicolor AM-OR11-026]